MKNLTKFPTTWFRQGLIIALAALLSLLYRNAYAQSTEKIDLNLQEATFEEAVEELRAEHVDAIEAMIEALEDEGSRKLIEIGMMLSTVNQKKSLPKSRPRVAR